MSKQQNVIVRHNSAHLFNGAQGRPEFDKIKAGGARRVMLEIGTGINKRRIVDPSPDILPAEPVALDAFQQAVLTDIKLRKQLDRFVRKASTDMAPRFVRPDGSRVPTLDEKSAAVSEPKADAKHSPYDRFGRSKQLPGATGLRIALERRAQEQAVARDKRRKD